MNALYRIWDKDMLTKMGVEMRAYFDLMKKIAVAYNNSTAKPEVQNEMKKKFLAMYDHITDQGWHTVVVGEIFIITGIVSVVCIWLIS